MELLSPVLEVWRHVLTKRFPVTAVVKKGFGPCGNLPTIPIIKAWHVVAATRFRAAVP